MPKISILFRIEDDTEDTLAALERVFFAPTFKRLEKMMDTRVRSMKSDISNSLKELSEMRSELCSMVRNSDSTGW